MRLLHQQEGEISHLLVQRAELSLHGGKLFGQRQQLSRQRGHLALHRSRWNFGKGRQAALMQASQELEMLLAQPFFAAIVGMALQGKLSIGEPAMQRFGIDAQVMSSLGHRHTDHGITPFVCSVQQERQRNLVMCRENSWEFRRQQARESEEKNSPQNSWQGQAANSGRTGFLATATMIIACPILMGAPKE